MDFKIQCKFKDRINSNDKGTQYHKFIMLLKANYFLIF